MSSNTSNIELFGRKWSLTITNANGTVLTIVSNTWTPEPLQITFDCYLTSYNAWWYADIAIYGLNAATSQIVLTQGMTVKLDAGYMKGQYGTIFEGTLLQPSWERENGIDFKITLHCVVGLVEQANNFVMMNLGSNLSQREIVNQMCQAAFTPVQIENLQGLDDVKESRGSVYFDQPFEYLKEFAATSQQNFWASQQGINIRQLKQQQSNVPTLVYGPQQGLLDSPQQTQDGVVMRVFLDPRVQVGAQVQLKPDTTIRQLTRQQGSYPTILDKQGLYAVAAVRHIGDSRGNTWDSEITGYTYIGSRLALLNPQD